MRWYIDIEADAGHGSVRAELEAGGDDIVQALEHALEAKRAQLRAVRIAGNYTGPSYGNPHCPSFEGFSSLECAADRFRERQETSGSYRLRSDDLTVTDGIITDVTRQSACWPATSAQDTLELYRVDVLPDGTRAIAGEPFMRLTAGPRGGVVRERF